MGQEEEQDYPQGVIPYGDRLRPGSLVGHAVESPYSKTGATGLKTDRMRKYLDTLPRASDMAEQEINEMAPKLQGMFNEINGYGLASVSAEQVRNLLAHMMNDLGMGGQARVIAGRTELNVEEPSVFMRTYTIRAGSDTWTVTIRRDVSGYWIARYFQ